jgi:hypothetical protein
MKYQVEITRAGAAAPFAHVYPKSLERTDIERSIVVFEQFENVSRPSLGWTATSKSPGTYDQHLGTFLAA